MKSLIQKLVETPGPSGSEQEIREVIRGEIASFANEIKVDALGNLIARKGEKSPEGMKVMLSAHMDEIGLMVTHIDDNGFIRFITIGGVHPRTCIGSRVIFMNKVRGVIYTERMDPPDKYPAIENLYIDVGAKSRAECPVKVGDTAGFDRPFMELGDRLVAKSMDDRISVAVLIETM